MASNPTIRGLQEAQRANLNNIQALRPTGALGNAVHTGTVMAEQAAVTKTHVITGSLRACHRMKVNGLRGIINLDPSGVNPRTKQKPSEYGVFEHARGGSHAFYARVESEDGRNIGEAIGHAFMRGLK